MGRLGIELSALSAQELRRLLEVARARGQEGLVQQLTAELNGRTAAWRPPSVVSVQTAGRPPQPAEARRASRRPIAAAGVGLAAAGLAWGLTVPLAPEQLARAQVEPPPPLRLTVALSPETPLLEAPSPEPTRATEASDGAALEIARTEPRPVRNPCYDEPTAAERLICGFPALAERHRRMLQAYDSARAAGADPLALDGAQAAWRARSANVSDRHLLADLYEERIRELRADAAAARRDQPPT